MSPRQQRRSSADAGLSSNARAALAALAAGYWPLPLIPGTKKPYVKWKRHQQQRPTEVEVRHWFAKWPDADLGAICGHPAGLWTWDADTPEQVAALRDAFKGVPARIVVTRRGIQVHVAPDRPRPKCDAVRPGLDFKGDKSITVLPPSKDKTWETPDAPLVPSPAALLALLDTPSSKNGKRPPDDPHAPPKASARIRAGEVIRKGARNSRLFRHGCNLRELRGLDRDGIVRELVKINAEQCDPPLDDAELQEIATNAAKYEPSEDDARLSDTGNARRFTRWYGEENLRYVKAESSWVVWDAGRWARDETGAVDRYAKLVSRELYYQAAAQEDDDRQKRLSRHASATASDHRLRAMVNLASTEPELALRPRDFNTDPWLFNVENGTLDLRTGTLRPHAREDMLTALAPVTFDPAATCPRWLAFLDRVTGSDADLAGYLQRVVGYTLTGDTTEQCIFMPWGPGANGKSTFLETLRQGVFGPDFARDTPLSTFLVGRDDTVRADVARLQGARLVTATETGEGRRLDEVLVKRLTGGDTMTARLLYHSHFEFVPQLKLYISTNYRPEIRGTDEAIWRRVRLIPFTANIPPAERDKHLVQKLVAEGAGILNWALEGCRAWQAHHGLGEPKAVKHATADYRREQDAFSEFLKDRCVRGEEQTVEAPWFRRKYEAWCRDEADTQPLTPQAFRRRMEAEGFILQKPHTGARVWAGVAWDDRL